MKDGQEYLHSELTDVIIKAFYAVYNRLGYGFLEKVYENAMFLELKEMGLSVADLVVENKVILELKAADGLRDEHVHQLINYLKATRIEVGILFNFGTKPQFKRKIFTNS